MAVRMGIAKLVASSARQAQGVAQTRRRPFNPWKFPRDYSNIPRRRTGTDRQMGS